MTGSVIGAAIEVHRTLGPGLLERVYRVCLARELEARRIGFATEVRLPVVYKGRDTGTGLRLDLVVESELLVEVKAVDALLPIHRAQTLTYLRLTGLPLALLINFNSEVLFRGLVRLINTPGPPPRPSASSVPRW